MIAIANFNKRITAVEMVKPKTIYYNGKNIAKGTITDVFNEPNGISFHFDPKFKFEFRDDHGGPDFEMPQFINCIAKRRKPTKSKPYDTIYIEIMGKK